MLNDTELVDNIKYAFHDILTDYKADHVGLKDKWEMFKIDCRICNYSREKSLNKNRNLLELERELNMKSTPTVNCERTDNVKKTLKVICGGYSC